MKQTSADSRIDALEVQLWINSQPEEGDFKKNKGEALEEPAWGRNKGNLFARHWVASALTPKIIKKEVITSSVDNYASICASVQMVQFCAQNSLTIVETKIKLDSHADK